MIQIHLKYDSRQFSEKRLQKTVFSKLSDVAQIIKFQKKHFSTIK